MSQIVPKDQLLTMVGETSPPSSWLKIDQDRINLFAEATGDHQYIHVDPAKAAQTPFGTTVAHGFLSLSLLPMLGEEVARVPEGTVMAINYGLNRLRFIQPVKVGSEVRLHSKIIDVTEKDPGRILVTSEATVEIQGEAKPALVAETLTMYFLGGGA